MSGPDWQSHRGPLPKVGRYVSSGIIRSGNTSLYGEKPSRNSVRALPQDEMMPVSVDDRQGKMPGVGRQPVPGFLRPFHR